MKCMLLMTFMCSIFHLVRCRSRIKQVSRLNMLLNKFSYVAFHKIARASSPSFKIIFLLFLIEFSGKKKKKKHSIRISHLFSLVSVELPLLSHDKPTSPGYCHCCRHVFRYEPTVILFSLSRSENHCRRCDRIREESARCDNPDDVLPLRLCADGPSDLHWGPHAKVYKELS